MSSKNGVVKNRDEEENFNYGDYYNSPLEFDAHYREIAKNMSEVLLAAREGEIDKAKRYMKYLKITDDFWETLRNQIDDTLGGDHFVKGLRKKRRKRFLSRLYQLHKAIHKTLEEEIQESEQEHYQALADTGFWGKAGAGCLIMARSTGRILIPLRSDYVEQPGTWGTWGGAIDKGENPKVAARREVQEEAGYHGPIHAMIHLYRYQSGDFRYDTFLALVEDEFNPNLNWESADAQWFEPGEWPRPLHFGLEAVLKDNHAAHKIETANG